MAKMLISIWTNNYKKGFVLISPKYISAQRDGCFAAAVPFFADIAFSAGKRCSYAI